MPIIEDQEIDMIPVTCDLTLKADDFILLEAALFSSVCAACGDRLKRGNPIHYYPQRKLSSHPECSVPDFENGYFLRLPGKAYSKQHGTCSRCLDIVWAGSYAFVSPGLGAFHLECRTATASPGRKGLAPHTPIGDCFGAPPPKPRSPKRKAA